MPSDLSGFREYDSVRVTGTDDDGNRWSGLTGTTGTLDAKTNLISLPRGD